MEHSSRNLVRDLMKVGVTSCPADTQVSDLAHLLLDKGIEAVIVLDEEGHAIGMVSQDELVDAFIRSGEDARSLKAGDIMSEEVPQVPPDIPVRAALQIMRDKGVRILFLMHHASGIQYPAAQLSYYHVLRALEAKENRELSDLGIYAARKSPIEVFVQKRDEARRSRIQK